MRSRLNDEAFLDNDLFVHGGSRIVVKTCVFNEQIEQEIPTFKNGAMIFLMGKMRCWFGHNVRIVT